MIELQNKEIINDQKPLDKNELYFYPTPVDKSELYLDPTPIDKSKLYFYPESKENGIDYSQNIGKEIDKKPYFLTVDGHEVGSMEEVIAYNEDYYERLKIKKPIDMPDSIGFIAKSDRIRALLVRLRIKYYDRKCRGEKIDEELESDFDNIVFPSIDLLSETERSYLLGALRLLVNISPDNVDEMQFQNELYQKAVDYILSLNKTNNPVIPQK